MESCPTYEELNAYYDGELPKERADAIAAHTEGCDLCLDLLESIASGDFALEAGAGAFGGKEVSAWLANLRSPARTRSSRRDPAPRRRRRYKRRLTPRFARWVWAPLAAAAAILIAMRILRVEENVEPEKTAEPAKAAKEAPGRVVAAPGPAAPRVERRAEERRLPEPGRVIAAPEERTRAPEVAAKGPVEEPAAPVVETVLPVARLARVVGSVYYRRAGGSWAKAAEGVRFLPADELDARGSLALVELDDRARMFCNKGSVIRVVSAASAFLARGEVCCELKGPGGLEVRTADGVARAVGTRFSVKKLPAYTAVAVERGRVRVEAAGGEIVLGPAQRSVFSAASPPSVPGTVDAARLLSWTAELEERAAVVWLEAMRAQSKPPMKLSAAYSSPRSVPPDEDPAADSLTGLVLYGETDCRGGDYTRSVPERAPSGVAKHGSASFRVILPRAGKWYLWARLYYPGGDVLRRNPPGFPHNDPNSFWAQVDSARPRLLGNLRSDAARKNSYYRKWHWDGEGRVEFGEPTPLELGELEAGEHTVTIYNRDALETARYTLSARLDVLCLTDSPSFVPTDAAYGRRSRR